MPQPGLDAADGQWSTLAGRSAAGNGVERPHLDRVTERGAGSVRLDKAEFFGGDARVGECGADDLLLGRSTRHGQTGGRAVVVDGRAAHDGKDRPALPSRIRQPHQDDHAGPLAAAVSVGGGGERL